MFTPLNYYDYARINKGMHGMLPIFHRYPSSAPYVTLEIIRFSPNREHDELVERCSAVNMAAPGNCPLNSPLPIMDQLKWKPLSLTLVEYPEGE